MSDRNSLSDIRCFLKSSICWSLWFIFSSRRRNVAAAGYISLFRTRRRRFSAPPPYEQAKRGYPHSACSAAARKRWQLAQPPLSSVSVRKRYNTRDFASKVVCHGTYGFFGFFQPIGRSLPCLITQRKGVAPLWNPCLNDCLLLKHSRSSCKTAQQNYAIWSWFA